MRTICAFCGKTKEVCDTPWVNGVKQPRPCKDCLIEVMKHTNYPVNLEWWFKQMVQTGERRSAEAVFKMLTVEDVYGRSE